MNESDSEEREFTCSGWPTGEEPAKHVQDLLRRTVRFLTQCSTDPRAAMESEDPNELILGLEAILRETPLIAPARDSEAEGTPPSIHIRRRRSA